MGVIILDVEQRTLKGEYRDGWESAAGNEAMPDSPTRPPSDEPADYANGFFYGRADALEQFMPGLTPSSAYGKYRIQEDPPVTSRERDNSE